MEGDSTPMAAAPMHVTQPEQAAQPTLAEPASGTVAEMSGALQGTDEPKFPQTTDIPNGLVEPSATSDKAPAEAPLDVPAPDQDTEMKDVPVAAPAATESTPVEANNTPTSSKKPTNGKRKSIGGVPEHKSKKLNKKKSMQKLKVTHLDAQPGDYFIARLKSYPPWPSIICDESMLPQSLLSTRPVTTKQLNGEYNEPYVDDGKKVAERTFPIMFLHTNEFAWIPNTDLTPYDPADVEEPPKKGRSKALAAAFEVAIEQHDLEFFKTLLAEHKAAIQEDEDIRAEKAAAKAAKSEKKKRKSEATAAADSDVDMEDAEGAGEVKKSSKKRKKELDSDDEPEKPPKTPKTPKTTKLKLTEPKAPGTSEKKAKEPKAVKPKAEKKKPKPASDADEEMADAEAEDSSMPLDPAEERKAREKEVLFLRHKLQKGFLSRDQAPQENEMAHMSNYIKKLEGYGDIEVAIIRATKINKVLKAVVKLNSIPREEEFDFKRRSMELLSNWNKLLGAETGDNEGAAGSAAEKDGEPTTNGVHKEDAGSKAESVVTSREKTAGVEEGVAAVPAQAAAPAEAMESSIETLHKEEPVKEVAPEDAPKPAEEPKVVDEPKPMEEPKPVEESKPIEPVFEPVQALKAAVPSSEATEATKAAE